jgi:hypothetical protein
MNSPHTTSNAERLKGAIEVSYACEDDRCFASGVIQHWILNMEGRTMLPSHSAKNALAISALCLSIMPPVASGGCPISVGRYVEFDFARSVECLDVTLPEHSAQYPNQRLIEMRLPVSVRFRGLQPDDVEELNVEINGAAAGLRVCSFSPSTQLASDLTREIETTTTIKKERSFGATLGGAVPLPTANVVAQVSPSINANTSTSETVTDKSNRLPPKYAVVVSGTSSDARGVFFKLKHSSQGLLEGVHELTVVFAAPVEWQGVEVRVFCSARGNRKVLWTKHPTTFRRETRTVQLSIASGMPRSHMVQRPSESVPVRNAW